MNRADTAQAPAILLISDDLALAKSRSLLLSSSGWQVDMRSSLAFHAADLNRYDLLLFCQTVSLQTVRDTAEVLSAVGSARPAMVRIVWANEATYSLRYETLLAPVGPRQLLDVVQASLGRLGQAASTPSRRTYALAHIPLALPALL